MAVSAELQIIVSAVNKAGEQIRALVTDLNKVAVALKSVDNSGGGAKASQDLKKLGTDAKGAKGDINDLTNQTNVLQSTLASLGDFAKLAAGGFLAFKGVQFAKGFADDAARAETLEVVLLQIGKNAGFTRKELQAADVAIQNLGITAQASRQSLSQFLQSGLDLSGAKQLARAAQDLAVIGNKNSSETFSQLITNIQQLDTVGLRFLGITTNIDAAVKKFEVTNKLAAGSLNQQQKQQALLNEVLEKSIPLQGTYEAALGTAGKKLTSLDRITQNLSTSIGKILLPAYTAIIDEFNTFLIEITKITDSFNENQTAAERFGEAIRTVAKTVFEAIESVVEFKKELVAIGALFAVGKIIQYGIALAGLFIPVTAATGAISALGIAIEFLGGPIAIGIGALITLYATSEDVRESINNLGLFVLDVVENALKPLAEILTVLAGPIILVTGLTGGLTLAVRLLGAAVSVMGGPIGIAIGLLITLYTKSETARQVINTLGLVLLDVAQRAIVPLAQGFAVLVAAYAGLKAAFSGGNPAKAFSDSLSTSLANINNNIATTDKKVASAFNSIGESSKKNVVTVTKNVDQTISAYKKQGLEIARLSELAAKQSERYETQAAKRTLEIQKKLILSRQALDKKLNDVSDSSKSTATEKAKVEALRKEEAQKAKAEADRIKARDQLATDKTTLGLDKVSITEKGVFTAENQKEIESFKNVYNSTIKDIGNTDVTTDKAKIAILELQTAYDNLLKTAKTPADFTAIAQLTALISANKDGVSKTIAPTVVKAAAKAKVEVDKKASGGAKKGSGVSDRKAFSSAVEDVAEANSNRAQALAVIEIKKSLEEIALAYEKGTLSVKDYYDKKRKLEEDAANQETQSIERKLARVDIEIASAKKNGLKPSEVKGLETKKIDLGTTLEEKKADIQSKINSLKEEEIKSTKVIETLTITTTQALLEEQGRLADAQRLGLNQELESKLLEVKGSDKDALIQRENIVQLIALKQKEVGLEERLNILNLEESKINLQESNIENLNTRNLLTKVEYESQIRAILAQKLGLAEKALNIAKQTAKEFPASIDAQQKLIDAQGKLNQLQTDNLTKFREYADSINDALKGSTEGFFNDLLDGTKSFQDAFKDAIKSIQRELNNQVSKKITDSIFGGVDVGGAVTGQTKEQQGGFSGVFEKIFTNIKELVGIKSKDTVGAPVSTTLTDKLSTQGTTPASPLFVSDISKEVGSTESLLEKITNNKQSDTTQTSTDSIEKISEVFKEASKDTANSNNTVFQKITDSLRESNSANTSSSSSSILKEVVGASDAGSSKIANVLTEVKNSSESVTQAVGDSYAEGNASLVTQINNGQFSFTNLFTSLKNGFTNLVSGISGFFKQLVTKDISKTTDKTTDKASVVQSIVTATKETATSKETNNSSQTSATNQVIARVTQSSNNVTSTIGQAYEGGNQQIATQITSGGLGFNNLTSEVQSNLNKILTAIKDFITELNGLSDNIKNPATAEKKGKDLIKGIFGKNETAEQGGSSVNPSKVDVLKEVTNNTSTRDAGSSKVTSILQDLTRSSETVTEGVGQAYEKGNQSLLEKITSGNFSFGSLLNGLKSGFGSLLDTISSFVSKLFNSSSGGDGGGFGEAIGSIASSIFSSFSFAEGGLVQGAGTGTSDSIRANISHGEYIVKAKQTSKFLPLLEAINSGKLNSFGGAVRLNNKPNFAEGGLVSIPSINTNNSSNANNSGNVNKISVNQYITTNDADSFRRSRDQIAAESGAAVQRALRRNR